jgi:hypothetical protein
VTEVPDAVRNAVDEHHARGGGQPAVEVNREAWSEALPAHRDFIESLPESFDRWTARAIVEALPDDEQRAIRTFIVSQIWGHGKNAYARFRVRSALETAGGRGTDRVEKAAVEFGRGGPLLAFEYLAERGEQLLI